MKKDKNKTIMTRMKITFYLTCKFVSLLRRWRRRRQQRQKPVGNLRAGSWTSVSMVVRDVGMVNEVADRAEVCELTDRWEGRPDEEWA